MEYNIEYKVSNLVLEQSRVPQEVLIKNVAKKFIQDLPLEEVKKLFNIELIRGTEEAQREAFLEYNTDKVNLIHQLRSEECSMYKAKIFIK